MRSQNLTNGMRWDILHALQKYGFGQEEVALLCREAELGRLVWEERFNAREQLVLSSVPSGWFPEIGTVAAQIAGQYVRLSLGGSLRVPAFLRDTPLAVFDGGTRVADEYADICKCAARLKEAKSTAMSSAKAVPKSVTTVAKLVRIWLGVAQFLPPDDMRPRVLPALPIQDLNNMLGLHATENA